MWMAFLDMSEHSFKRRNNLRQDLLHYTMYCWKYDAYAWRFEDIRWNMATFIWIDQESFDDLPPPAPMKTLIGYERGLCQGTSQSPAGCVALYDVLLEVRRICVKVWWSLMKHGYFHLNKSGKYRWFNSLPPLMQKYFRTGFWIATEKARGYPLVL